jgi:signal transduction histidine kinase
VFPFLPILFLAFNNMKIIRPCLLLLIIFSINFGVYSQNVIPFLKKDSFNISRSLANAEKCKISGDKREESRHYDTVALVHWEHNQFPKAILFYEKSLALNEQLENVSGVSMINSNLAMINADMHNYQKSLDHFQKTLDYRRKVKEKVGIISVLINMSVVLNNLKQYDQSVKKLEEALKLASEMNDIEQMKSCYGMLSETFEKAQNPKKAQEYFEKYRTWHEEIQKMKESKSQQLVQETNLKLQLTETEKKNKELELKLANSVLQEKESALELASDSARRLYANLSRAELTNELLKKDNLIKDISIKNEQVRREKQQQALWLLMAILVLVGGLLLAFIRGYIRKQKTNKLLQYQKQQIEEQAVKLSETNAKLIELDKFKEGMTGMIVHDLKNPLNAILGLSNEPATQQAGKQMLNMVLNILDVQKFENAAIKLNIGPYNTLKICNKALQQVKHLYERKSINLTVHIPEKLMIKADTEIMERIFINLFTNAIKYTPNNGNIKIEAEKLGVFAKISVSDNGLGIPREYQNIVFDKFSQVEARDSGGVRSTGLGLTFCKLAVEAHGGNISLESEPEHGASFIFLVPLSETTEPVVDAIENIQVNEVPQNHILSLSANEIIQLSQYVVKLEKLSVYEYSKIKTVFEGFETNNSENIEQWKNQLINAVKACNEVKYNELLILAKPSEV